MAKAKLFHVVGISKGFRLKKDFSEKNFLIEYMKNGANQTSTLCLTDCALDSKDQTVDRTVQGCWCWWV